MSMIDKASGDLFTGEIPEPSESNTRTDWRGIFREISRLWYASLWPDYHATIETVAKMKGIEPERLRSWFEGAQSSKWFENNVPTCLASKAWENNCVKELINL